MQRVQRRMGECLIFDLPRRRGISLKSTLKRKFDHIPRGPNIAGTGETAMSGDEMPHSTGHLMSRG